MTWLGYEGDKIGLFYHAPLANPVQSVYKYTMNSRDIIAALLKDGWFQVAQKGSHVQFKHQAKTGRVTVPHPRKDVPLGTLRSIEVQAKLKLR